MAKVIFSRFRGTDQQRDEINDVLGHQDDAYFYVVTGDADADGQITSGDARLILRAVVGLEN